MSYDTYNTVQCVRYLYTPIHADHMSVNRHMMSHTLLVTVLLLYLQADSILDEYIYHLNTCHACYHIIQTY